MENLLEKYLVKTARINNVRDYVVIPTIEEIQDVFKVDDYDERIAYPTDYAVMKGVEQFGDDTGMTRYWLDRNNSSASYVCYVNKCGYILSSYYPTTYYFGVRPALKLNLKSVISAQSAASEFFKINSNKKTIEFGLYPQDYVLPKDEELYSQHSKYGTFKLKMKKFDDYARYENGFYAPDSGTPVCALIKPIEWVITNWEDLPTSINPDGSGEAQTIDLISEKVLFPMAFSSGSTYWENSKIRAYLNGYVLEKGSANNENFITQAILPYLAEVENSINASKSVAESGSYTKKINELKIDLISKISSPEIGERELARVLSDYSKALETLYYNKAAAENQLRYNSQEPEMGE